MSANQASKPIPEAKGIQIVDGCEDEQGEQKRKPAAERPILRPNADRPAPNGFDSIEEEMAAIQHRDWQEVDESEIN